MAITNPTAIRYSNEKLRVAADKLAQAFNFANAVVDEWAALNMASLITNTSDIIEDGSDVDGRPVITGIMGNNIINRLNELIADYEASGGAKLNTILQVAVNTGI